MKTFKWTAPEPHHPDPGRMGLRECEFWQRVRARGVEWYVVSKGLLFMLGFPLLTRACFGVELDTRALIEGWVSGLACGYAIWLRREARYRRALESGVWPPG